MESYCCHTQRLPQMFGLASSRLRSPVKSRVEDAADNLMFAGMSRGTGGSQRSMGRL